jgi:sugar/nucleoside kinase (ribokinase family)
MGTEDIDYELLKSIRHLHIGSYFLMKKLQPCYLDIIKTIKENGGTISLDTNWDPEETWDSGVMDVIRLVDVIFPNENEAMAIMKEDTAQKALEKLIKIVPVVAVKMGKDGAVTHFNGKTAVTPAVDVKKVDAVGAGDSFDGGFLYGYLTGKSIEECAKIGCICGSLNTRCSGGTRGQPVLEEMMKYL